HTLGPSRAWILGLTHAWATASLAGCTSERPPAKPVDQARVPADGSGGRKRLRDDRNEGVLPERLQGRPGLRTPARGGGAGLDRGRASVRPERPDRERRLVVGLWRPDSHRPDRDGL